jgi:succinylarginine dihydrolase
MKRAEGPSEWNFDGIIGPSYCHPGAAPASSGNLAATANRGQPSNPRKYAEQALDKVETLRSLGVKQALLPPPIRPNLELLWRTGLIKHRRLGEASCKSLSQQLAEARRRSPLLVAAAFAPSGVWTANWATASPSKDAVDGKAHFTPANQSAQLHRSIEATEVHALLKRIFRGQYFVVHEPLPSAYELGDEGSANLIRLASRHGAAALNVFVYGRDGDREAGSRYLPRQTRAACEAIARLHGLRPEATLLVQQHPDALNAGAFHNDVVMASHLDLLLYHQRALAGGPRAIVEIDRLFRELTGQALQLIEVREDEVSLEDALASYLFNSQLVTGPEGRVLIAPCECASLAGPRALIEKLKRGRVISDCKYVDVTGSMRNGGGPACLRLRIVLTAKQAAAVGRNASVIADDRLMDGLRAVVGNYQTNIDDETLIDADFLADCFRRTRDVYDLLGLPCEIPAK